MKNYAVFIVFGALILLAIFTSKPITANPVASAMELAVVEVDNNPFLVANVTWTNVTRGIVRLWKTSDLTAWSLAGIALVQSTNAVITLQDYEAGYTNQFYYMLTLEPIPDSFRPMEASVDNALFSLGVHNQQDQE